MFVRPIPLIFILPLAESLQSFPIELVFALLVAKPYLNHHEPSNEYNPSNEFSGLLYQTLLVA
jgi:hypothetical protein